MKVLSIYYSTTGNTEKVANTIEETVKIQGHEIEVIKITNELKEKEVNLLNYDLIFTGSGVYQWLPGKPLQEFLTKTLRRYVKKGEVKPCAPRRVNKNERGLF